ncbi:MAG: hypothetical protein H8E60_11025 [Candidatus Marinimicrobia bacterium]|nr:hypothetical protein [Candidatus Neomarinimicrobiota bacterium]
MEISISLSTLDIKLKRLLTLFIVVLTIGITTGLIYLSFTTGSKISGIEEHYKGSVIKYEFDIPEKYPKTVQNLLLTTHNHLLSLSIIFLIIGGIFSHSTSIKSDKLKSFLIYEPFFSIILTFGGIWGLRYLHPLFLWVIIISGTIMYSSFYFMALVSIFELNKK